MTRHWDNPVSMGFLLAAALTQSALAQPPLGPAQIEPPPRVSVIHRVTESGVNIVRMPPRPVLNVPSTTPAAQEKPQPPSPPSEPEQPQGRLLRLPVTLGSQPKGTQNGFLGV